MRKFFLAALVIFPLMTSAQTNTVLTPEQQLEKAQKQLEEAQKAVEKAKAEAEKAKQAKEQAQAKARKKAIKDRQDSIQEQIRKAQEEAARLNAEAQRLNKEANKLNSDSAARFSPSGWTAPQPAERASKAKPASTAQASPNSDSRYLDGAVPEVDGKVVFTLDIDVPGKNAFQIYDITYNYLDQLAQGPDEFDESAVVLLNKDDHIIAARYKEWLTFSNNFISLDRTEFNYTIIAQCSDHHLHMMMERINYNYEEGRNTGFKTSAEKWITDKYSLNKKHTKLSKISGKFRRKTIDRKDEIFKGIKDALFN